MKRLFSAVIAAFIIFSITVPALSVPTLAADSSPFPFSQRTVRVGISPFPNFTQRDDNGNYSGIVIDYINEIKKYTGWNVEYVFTDPDKAIDLLDTGKIDLIGAMNKTPETSKLYNFAELNSGYAYSTITTKKTHTEFIPNDYDTFKHIKIAVYNRATSRVDAFHQFCSANGLDVVPVYFDDPVAWENAFATGEVDAQLTSSAKLRDDEKIIANFKQELYYFGVTKENTAVLRELNHALGQINQVNPNFDANLYMKYFGKSRYDAFSLTPEERKFVSDHPVLRVAAAPNWPPISYFDQDGQLNGISADILDLISEKTGFQIEYVPTASFQESVQLLNTNQVDILMGSSQDSLLKSVADLTFSLPYLPLQTVILHRSGDNLQSIENPTMAVVYGFERRVLDNCTKQNYDTVTEAIHAVKTGMADFTAISNLAANQYISSNGKGQLILVPMPNIESDLSIALSSPTNPTLLTILDSAIYSISDAQQQSIIFQNTSAQHDITLKSFIYANPMQTVMVIILIGTLIFFLLFLIMTMQLRLSRKAALVSDAYRIVSELSDEYIFAYDFETAALSLPERFAKLAGTDLLINRKDCHEGGICQLICAFNDSNQQPSFSVKFHCTMANGSDEMFRAICMIIYDNIDRPLRGIGKLISIQAEFDEKQQLEKMVNTDLLTGLYSKSYCEQWAENSIANGSIAGCGALLLIDIDNFKDANDTLGHLGGDEALKCFSKTLKAVFTDDEVLGRWGGDEFIVFINHVVDIASVEKKAQELCSLANYKFTYDDADFNLSISMGIALTDGAEAFRDVFQAADKALYQVKRENKNSYQFAKSSLD